MKEKSYVFLNEKVQPYADANEAPDKLRVLYFGTQCSVA
jgi:hypothetical protein